MPPAPKQPRKMPFEKYRRQLPLVLADRTWPDQRIEKAPLWCSVDLRDGNQALIDPMDPARKLRMFTTLVDMGFKEIEVGFPSASQPDFDFIRSLIEEDRIPDDVIIQVLVQCRPELIERTYECIKGAPRAIVHFYNSTSELQRRVVFGLDKQGIVDIAVNAAKLCRKLEDTVPTTAVRYEYSPESFTGTEPDFAVEICEAVMDVVEPTVDRKIVLNLPATVECYTPNIYGDVIEWFHRNIKHRDRVCLSLHPHNDRGCGVAAAEFGVMAGADRVEGTLFGNGERPGNVDIVNLAMNLFSQGVDPELDISDIDALRRVAVYCNRLPVHERHPYAGDLVYTSFSGSHQDAIKKGLDRAASRLRRVGGAVPADRPAPRRPHVRGRHPREQPVGEGRGRLHHGVRARHDPASPAPDRVLEGDPARSPRTPAPRSVPPTCGTCSRTSTCPRIPRSACSRTRRPRCRRRRATWHASTAQLVVDGKHETVQGEGNGPIDAFVHGLRGLLGVELDVVDYSEHAVSAGADAQAAAYVETVWPDGQTRWGVGMDSSILTASLKAVVSAVNARR